MSEETTSRESESRLDEEIERRRAKIAEAQARGRKPFGEAYDVTSKASVIVEKCDEMAGESVRVAGRIMALRGHGKATFADLRDRSGRIQTHFRVDVLGEGAYKDFEDLVDIGDIVGVEGTVFRTKRGEPTVEAKNWTFLSSRFAHCPRNGTDLPTWIFGTVRGTWISS